MAKRIFTGWCALLAVVLLATGTAQAANIFMIGSDTNGAITSFNGGVNWPGGLAPTNGNAYFTGANIIRTPLGSSDYTFAGDSLSIDSGGNMNLKTTPSTITITNLILNGGAMANGIGPLTVAGNIIVTATSTVDVQGSGRNLTIVAPISGTNTITEKCLQSGMGTVILSASNSFSGLWIIDDAFNPGLRAYLNLAHSNALKNSTLSLTTTNDSYLLFSSGINTFTVGGLTGNGNFGITNVGGSSITLRVGNNNASTIYSGSMRGGGSLVKIGTGMFVLLGTNTYTGGTIVSNGTLGGTGVLTGSVSVASGGTLLPGTNGAGTLTVGSLTLDSGATFAVQLGGTNVVDHNQLMVASGGISLNNSVLSLSLTNSFMPKPGNSFTVVRNVPNNPVTGTFACGNILRVPGIAGSFFVNYAGGAGNDVVLQCQADGTVMAVR
jgi:autotransporter-associated beta strand protein